METIPKVTEMGLDLLAEMAVDCWRLNRWIEGKGVDDSLTVPRHVLRRMSRFLESCAISTVDLTGQAFDPGLALEVIDLVDDSDLAPESSVIKETLSPLIMWNNRTIKHSQVVVHSNNRHNNSEESTQ